MDSIVELEGVAVRNKAEIVAALRSVLQGEAGSFEFKVSMLPGCNKLK